MKKLNIWLIFWGKSVEHEASLLWAKNVIKNIDRKKFNLILIWIDKEWIWHLYNKNPLLNENDSAKIKLAKNISKIAILPWSNWEILILNKKQEKIKIDVALPVIHWTNAEDWSLQWLLKLLNIPFVWAWILWSAIWMDKDIMKKLLINENIPIWKFISLRKNDKVDYSKITQKLGKIIFVKPANWWSSVWINKAKNKVEFLKSIEEAFKYDNKIVIEEYIPWRELECAILGNDKLKVSLVWEIIPNHEFYSYEAKYIDNNWASLIIPAKIWLKVLKEIQNMALKIYKILCCEWLARLDFFLSKNNKIYFNEINTLPWFTKISMYPKLIEYSWINYINLITKLIELAIERFKIEEKFTFNKK